jgi:hypothetical protein
LCNIQVSSEVVWKQISLQLPEGYGEEADCPEKKKYGAILQAAQVCILTLSNSQFTFIHLCKINYKIIYPIS